MILDATLGSAAIVILSLLALVASRGALFGVVSGSVVGAMAFHIGLNLVWELFAIGQTAIGNTEANVARVAAVLVGIFVAYFVGRVTRAHPQEPR